MQTKKIRLSFPDAIRGYAILAITLNHISALTTRMGRSGADLLTLTQIGYSSSAELFVGVSGLLFGLVYWRRYENDPVGFVYKGVGRVSKIYVYNLFLLSLLSATIAIFPTLATITGLGTPQGLDPTVFLDSVMIRGAPYLVGVLLLYIVLIALTLVLVCVLRSKMLIVATSIALYLLGQYLIFTGHEVWLRIGFNPLTWQLIFVIPAVIGVTWKKETFLELVQRPVLVLAVCVVIYAIFMASKATEVFSHSRVSENIPLLFDKEGLGALRVFHGVLTFVILAIVFELLEKKFAVLTRMICSVGTVSLETFCFSCFAAYVCAGLWDTMGRGTYTYFALCLLGVGLTFCFAIGLSTFKKRAAKGATPRSVPQTNLQVSAA